MPDAEALRRLGGGRWETKDGRFRIEPQSGTWMVVDAEQADDLGLPLVRGPFRSLGAARDAIDEAREQGASVSPLAGIVEAAKGRPSARSAKRDASRARRATRKVPDEPTWMGKLDETQRRRARSLLRRLEKAGVPEAQAADVVRAELVEDRPALAQLALERRLRAVLDSATDADSVARAAADVIVSGTDASLGVGWRLTDTDGRPIRDVLVPRQGLPRPPRTRA